MVFKRYPEKLAADSYTPQTLKLQILLVGLAVLLALIGLVTSTAVLLASALALLLAFLTTFPFATRMKGSLALKLLAPVFLIVQAGAIGWGTFLGIFGRIENYEIGGRKARV